MPEPEDYPQLVSYYTQPAYSGEHTADGNSAVTIAISKKVGNNGVTAATAIL
jgi:hypothetical protein